MLAKPTVSSVLFSSRPWGCRSLLQIVVQSDSFGFTGDRIHAMVSGLYSLEAEHVQARLHTDQFLDELPKKVGAQNHA